MITQREKLRKAFFEGREMSARQITAQFGIASPSKVVSQLRMEDGMSIYNNRHVDTKGRVVNKYRLGTPSRKVIAAGYRALAGQVA
jgi:predicted transcriptional regulator